MNAALPAEQVTSEQIEDTLADALRAWASTSSTATSEEGEEPSASRRRGQGKRTTRKRPSRAAATSMTTIIGRTDDPVRMYLREMGSVELLSREGEIAIAKRIEAGRDKMIGGLCESPLTDARARPVARRADRRQDAAARHHRSRCDHGRRSAARPTAPEAEVDPADAEAESDERAAARREAEGEETARPSPAATPRATRTARATTRPTCRCRRWKPAEAAGARGSSTRSPTTYKRMLQGPGTADRRRCMPAARSARASEKTLPEAARRS